MSFGTILYTLLFQPLQVLFEVIYSIANSLIGNMGLSIIALSVAMNFLVLPLYRRADAMQEQERDIEAKLEKGVSHIKKTFKGDERMMMLQTYYRQNNYKPTYVLRGATSLLLQIPFFIAAYNFLSSLEALNGVSFGLISDLSKPDGLLTVFGLSINVLPILMTAINLISSSVYSKNYPLKTKIQLYVTALFFLVFLYNSPSGLVFYWTLNNAFSLLKTITLKSKNPSKIAKSLVAIGGVVILVYSLLGKELSDSAIILSIIGVLLVFPILFELVRKGERKRKNKATEYSNNTRLFFAGCTFMAILTGAVIPSAVISSSPQEFVFTDYFQSPLWYIVSSSCLAVGTFIIWFGIFYWLASPKNRAIYDKAIWIICCFSVTNYMFFGKNAGTLTSTLQVKSPNGTINTPVVEMIINLIVLAVIGVVVYFAYKKFSKQVVSLLMVCSIAFGAMTLVNVSKINSSISKIDTSAQEQDSFNIELSKTGKNVVVIMLDRAFGPYIPYLFNEKPELVEKFNGFTYYSNTISFGGNTNVGSPSLFGGYEYTPTEMNSRQNEKLVDKHNEALKIMPAIFSNNGYDVTVCNPNYANYQWIPDLSIYDDLEGVEAYNTGNSYIDVESKENIIKNNRRNFFMYSIMKSAPIITQNFLYNCGEYYGPKNGQTINGFTASGVDYEFLNAYSVLTSLPSLTSISSNQTGNVLIMTNDTTHNDSQVLQEPDYVPVNYVDNKEHYKNLDRFTLNGRTLNINNLMHIATYQSDMAAFIQIGNWLDYLREIDVYDNTKIILVSDHGAGLNQINELILEENGANTNDMECFTPLLMVKDFNSSDEFCVSDEFMTNADVPTIAFEDIIKNPINPYTNKNINNAEKYAHKQYIISTYDWTVTTNNGNQFSTADWYSVHDSIWNKDNWELVATKSVLTNDDVK